MDIIMIGALMAMQNQFRVFHWQTESHAQHVAFGGAYESLDELIDEFVEVYQGKKGALMGKQGFTVKLVNLSDDAESFIDDAIEYFRVYLPKSLDSNVDTDLLNIKDEMMAILNQTKYRLHMM